MPNFSKKEPIGIDFHINNMQNAIYENFSQSWGLNVEDWNCYPRCYRLFDSDGKEYLPYLFLQPQNINVLDSTNEENPINVGNEYEQPAFFEDTIKLQSFFDILETQKIDESCQSSCRIVLYFFTNLQSLFTSQSASNDELMANEVASFVKNQFGFILNSKRIGIKTIMKDFSGYMKDSILTSNMMPLNAFSLEFEINEYQINYNNFLINQILYQHKLSFIEFGIFGKVGDEEQLPSHDNSWISSDETLASITPSGYLKLIKESEGNCEISYDGSFIPYSVFISKTNKEVGIEGGNLLLMNLPNGIDQWIQSCQINFFEFFFNVFNASSSNILPLNFIGNVLPKDYNSFGRVRRNYKIENGSKQYYPQYYLEKNNEYIDVLFEDTVAIQTFFDVGEATREQQDSLLSYINIHFYVFVDLSKLYVRELIGTHMNPNSKDYAIPTRMDEEFILLVSQWFMENSGFELYAIQRGIKTILNEYNGFKIKTNSRSNMQPFLCFRLDMKKYYDESITNCQLITQ